MSEASIRLLTSRPSDWVDPPPSSCGLDIWQSELGQQWVRTFFGTRWIWLTITEGSEQAALTFIARKLAPGLFLGSAYPYGTVHGSASCFARNLVGIKRALLRQGIVRLEIPFTGEYASQHASLPRNEANRAAAEPLGAERQVLNLDGNVSMDDFQQRFDPNVRWAVRKAVREQCRVSTAGVTELRLAQSLYEETMRAKGAPVNYSAKRFSGIIDTLSRHGRGTVYLGFVGDVPAGMAAVVDGAISRHLIQLAVPPQWHASRLGELLTMTAISEGRAAGKRYFDFMASSTEDRGLIAFKRKWGGTSEPIDYLVLESLPMLGRAIAAGRLVNRKLAARHAR
jgi:hypothetical protein